jgi:uncharacterized protein YoxC
LSVAAFAAANFGGYCNEVDLRECGNGLREAVNDLREAVNDLWEAVNDLREAVNDFREAVNDLREAVNDLWEAVNDFREAVNDLREAVNDVRETVNGLGASDAVPSRGQRAATKGNHRSDLSAIRLVQSFRSIRSYSRKTASGSRHQLVVTDLGIVDVPGDPEKIRKNPPAFRDREGTRSRPERACRQRSCPVYARPYLESQVSHDNPRRRSRRKTVAPVFRRGNRDPLPFREPA